MAEVVLPQGSTRKQIVEILAHWNKFQVAISESSEVVCPTMKIDGKIVAIGIPAIASAMATMTKGTTKTWAKDVLGFGNATNAAAIAQFVDFAESLASCATDSESTTLIGQLQTALKPRVFVATENISMADVLLYAAAYPRLSQLSDSEKMAFNDVFRWCDHVHYLIESPLAPIALKHPQYHHKVAGAHEHGAAKVEGAAQPHGEKKEKKHKEKAEGAPAAQAAPAAPVPEIDQACNLDVRIGKIIKVMPHPDADTLYCEEIDIGGKVIHVVTGVRLFVPIEQMQDRHVVVFCNIKPSKIRGQASDGMVFAGSNEAHDKVELLDPPADAPIGTRVQFGEAVPVENPPLDKKGNIWKAVCDHLKVNADGHPCYKDHPLACPQGMITVPTLRNCEFH